LLLGAATGGAQAQVRIADAVAVTPNATGELGGVQVEILTGAELYEG